MERAGEKAPGPGKGAPECPDLTSDLLEPRGTASRSGAMRVVIFAAVLPALASAWLSALRSKPVTSPPTKTTLPVDDRGALTAEEIERYSRHLILEDVGVGGQLALKRASVAVVGAGGLGCPALLYLAAAGVGRITIIDDDVVDASNLQRQIAHATENVGVAKTASAAEAVRRANPLVDVVAVNARLSRETAEEILAGHDVVLDGCDNFETKYVLDDACGALGIPLVYAAILRFEGQASVFHYPPGGAAAGARRYRDLLPEAPAAGSVPSCAEGGVLGVLPGVLGCIQATEALKVLLGRPPEDTLSGRVLVYDALRMAFREIPLAARAPEEAEAAAPAPAEVLSAPAAVLSAAECAERLGGGWAPFVLDVRLPQEAEICRLPFADALVPHRNVAAAAADLPRDRDILVHCKSGFRSRAACRSLAALGFDRLFDLDGGILAWARDVDPRIPSY